MSVLKLKPSCKDYLWGGHRLVEEYGKEYDGEILAETWELSCHPDGPSTIVNGAYAGKTLEEYIEAEGKEVLGTNCRRFRDFPILTKFIDAKQDLSIQVHPDNRYALKNEGQYGKTEMWYLVGADRDAELIMGFNKDTDKSEYLTALHNHTLPVLLNTEKVEKGDCFFIPAGTVHAICKGCYIAEIQQTSDITYRIYDYDRRDKNGNPRELHTELATDVINFCEQKQHSIHYHQHENHTEELVSCNYFTTNYLKFDKEVEKDYIELDSFVIYMCLEGNFTLVYDVDKTVKVNKGETILVPAILKNLFLIPETEAEILEIYIR